MHRSTVPALSAQRGASLIEFSVVAVPLLLVGLGALEITVWFFTKQAVSLALLQAGRAAIVDHANPRTIETAFEQAMLPLFSSTTRPRSQQRLQTALEQRQRVTGQAPWQIQRLSPTAAAFLDFGDPTLRVAGAPGLAAINNNYLAEQHARQQRSGRPNGHGPASGKNIFQANTLVLRLHWLHQPMVPGMSGLLRLLGNPQGSYSQRAMALGGYLPLSLDITLMMQSHPVSWPAPANGKVIGPEATAGGSHSLASAPCTGIWCLRTPMALGSPATPAPDGEPAQDSSLPALPPDGVQPAPDPIPQDIIPDMDAPTPGPDDMACGISLCCLD